MSGPSNMPSPIAKLPLSAEQQWEQGACGRACRNYLRGIEDERANTSPHG